MPSLAALHPQVVHFVVALIVVGVLCRLASLWLKATWLSPAALTLIALGTLASLVAVRSGVDAHGPVEQVPGVRDAVVEHETWGERARNAFLVLLALEAVAATLATRQTSAARPAAIAAAVVGVLAIGVVYRVGDLGGRLVYEYAGGVGLRSGDPAAVNRLYIAGAYQQARQDRQAGRLTDAAALMAAVAARFPDHLELQLSQVESILTDRQSPGDAIARLDAIRIATDDTRMRVRAGVLRAQALTAAGDVNAARQVLQTLKSEFPGNAGVQRRLDDLDRAK